MTVAGHPQSSADARVALALDRICAQLRIGAELPPWPWLTEPTRRAVRAAGIRDEPTYRDEALAGYPKIRALCEGRTRARSPREKTAPDKPDPPP